MRNLYSEIEPRHAFQLAVGDGHVLHIEECGHANGIPVLFLHGGPGAGCENWHRRFFNPHQYRIILFDQRGCGRSTPHADIENNTTQHLISDIEKIRKEMDVERWVVFGGSWGSTLGLAYAQSYPQQCLGLILRGIFLCRHEDIQWFYQQGANVLFPDFWQDFQQLIPVSEQDDMVAAYYQRLRSKDQNIKLQAAMAWSTWEAKTSSLQLNSNTVKHLTDAHTAMNLARLECHYFINKIFMPENALVNNAHLLQTIPGIIVHGRYDVVCPVAQAFALHEYWPQAQLHIVDDAGHSAHEKGIVHHLIEATDHMAQQILK